MTEELERYTYEIKHGEIKDQYGNEPTLLQIVDALNNHEPLTDNQRKGLELFDGAFEDEEKYEYEWKHSDNDNDWRDIQVQDYQELCRTLIRRPRKPEWKVRDGFLDNGEPLWIHRIVKGDEEHYQLEYKCISLVDMAPHSFTEHGMKNKVKVPHAKLLRLAAERANKEEPTPTTCTCYWEEPSSPTANRTRIKCEYYKRADMAGGQD